MKRSKKRFREKLFYGLGLGIVGIFIVLAILGSNMWWFVVVVTYLSLNFIAMADTIRENSKKDIIGF